MLVPVFLVFFTVGLKEGRSVADVFTREKKSCWHGRRGKV